MVTFAKIGKIGDVRLRLVFAADLVLIFKPDFTRHDSN
jgi:hypothetical protein